MRFVITLCLFLGSSFISLAAVGQAVLAKAGQDELVVRVQGTGADSLLTVSISNTGTSVRRFLTWNTPFESELTADVFDVRPLLKGMPGDARMAYTGLLAKRGEPDANAYLTLQPGESYSVQLDISRHYHFDKGGRYAVSYHQQLVLDDPDKSALPPVDGRSLADILLQFSDNPDLPVAVLPSQSKADSRENIWQLSSNIASITARATVPVEDLRFARPTFSACSASQQGVITSALELSEVRTREDVATLAGLTSNELSVSPRYRAWFGSYSAQRHATVSGTMERLEAALERQRITFDCRCVRGDRELLFGFIRRDIPFLINLCPLFFSQPKEQVVTLVHEVSHFNEVGPTLDFAYGPGASQQLAARSPGDAVRNGDSYGYFVANNVPELALDGAIETASPSSPTRNFEFAGLQGGEQRRGDVAVGEVDLFTVSGITSLSLQSISGDADLYVFSDAALTQLICSSEAPVADDICTVLTPRTLYVAVLGASDSVYLLSTNQSAPAAANFVSLQSGQASSGTLATGESDYYTVSDVRTVALDSLNGDADLYVYNSQRFDAESLVCESFLFARQSMRDVCRVPEESTLYIRVFGYETADYLISTGDASVDDTSSGPTVIPIAAGDTLVQSNSDGDISLFSLSGPGRLDVLSNRGDADLFVFRGSDLENPVCASEGTPPAVMLDSCVFGDGDYIAAVPVYGNTEFTLSFGSGEGESVFLTQAGPSSGIGIGDDSFSSGTGSGGGGGAIGLFWLFCILPGVCRVLGVTRRRRFW